MPFTLTMPKLSPTMEEGVITTWFKKEGDYVEVGDLLMEVSTDKAQVEYQAIDEGFLRRIILPEGGEGQVNQCIAIFSEKKEEDITQVLKSLEKEKKQASEQDPAQALEKQEKSPSVSISKEPPCKPPASNVMTFEPAGEVEVDAFAFIEQEGQSRVKASPLAKKIADEKGLELQGLKGSGPGGRVVKKDLDYAMKKGPVGFSPEKRPQHPPGAYEPLPLTPMRKSIAERLQAAKATIPHYYVTNKTDARALIALRLQLKEMGVKVSVNDFIVKACGLALRQHPEINRGFDSKNHRLIQFQSIDICVAVSLESGLITPILFHADYKNLGQLSTEIKALALLAKEGKLQPHQYQGGSFTVSNLGMYGVENFQAVINPPQGAILAVSGILPEPIIKEGKLEEGHFMKLCLSSDHRVIDGAQAASFLKTLQHFLENPAALLL